MGTEILSVRATNKLNNVMKITFKVDGEVKSVLQDCTSISPYKAVENYLESNNIDSSLSVKSYEEGKRYDFDHDDISVAFNKISHGLSNGIENPKVRELVLKVSE